MVSSTAVAAALTSTGLISLAPNLLLLLFPRYASGEGEASRFLALGQALAAGGLLGDVFLHTIPHAAGGHDVGLWVLLGFSVFLVMDMVIRSLGSGHSHKDRTPNNGDKPQESNDHHHHREKSSNVLLNLVADALHNFTDGLAIGASFAIQGHDEHYSSFGSMLTSRGGLATVSILFHEIPHELGDFAILVKNGMSKQRAILAQFGTAVAAMLGTFVGLFLQGWVAAGDESLIFLTAGGFVYLATVTIIPDVLDEGTSFQFRLAQLTCFASGIAFLYAVTLLEEGDHGHGSNRHGAHSHSHGHHHHYEVHQEDPHESHHHDAHGHHHGAHGHHHDSHDHHEL